MSSAASLFPPNRSHNAFNISGFISECSNFRWVLINDGIIQLPREERTHRLRKSKQRAFSKKMANISDKFARFASTVAGKRLNVRRLISCVNVQKTLQSLSVTSKPDQITLNLEICLRLETVFGYDTRSVWLCPL